MKVLVMADGEVGAKSTAWLLEHYKTDVVAVITTEPNHISSYCTAADIPTYVFEDERRLLEQLGHDSMVFDIGLLVWWPYILGSKLISKAESGFFNTHPSLLPHNRGKHYNFWALVEQAPFGVTIHRVDGGVDSGPIVAQQTIPYDWTDNGGTLYAKAQAAVFDLLKCTYPALRVGSFVEMPQPSTTGSFHLASELDAASTVDLEKKYTARELLNLLRARTFVGYPSCRFTDQGETFEVRVEIARTR